MQPVHYQLGPQIWRLRKPEYNPKGMTRNSKCPYFVLNGKEYQAAQGFLAEKVALVTRLDTVGFANGWISKIKANLKDKEKKWLL